MAAKKLIKFYATWCGPCKAYNPIWEQVVSSYRDQIDVISIDIDKDTAGFAAKYKVMSVPTTILIREDGSEIKKSGLLQEQQLTELILS